jgi:DNA-binding XRE family transcriptional regulator
MPIKVRTLSGEEVIQMDRSEYENLIDARDHAIAMRDVASGNMPVISDNDMDAYLAATTPLAFWRKHRGLTQAQLATAVEVTQPHIAQIENGQREASAAIYAKMARRLGIRTDDLIA